MQPGLGGGREAYQIHATGIAAEMCDPNFGIKYELRNREPLQSAILPLKLCSCTAQNPTKLNSTQFGVWCSWQSGDDVQCHHHET